MKPINFIVLALILCVSGCSIYNEITVFSSRSSPNGSNTAENVMVGEGERAFGQMIIHSKNDWTSQKLFLGAPEADLFLRWVDNEHLQLWRSSDGGIFNRYPSEFPQKLGNVQIDERVYSTAQENTSFNLKHWSKEIEVPSENLIAKFVERNEQNERHCILSLEIPETPTYDLASFELEVSVSKNNSGKKYAELSSRFKLANPSDENWKYMLTSATVSNIPSYNGLSEGADGTQIRGQFLGSNALTLIEKLKSNSIQLEYSRNFFEQTLKYNIPTHEIKEKIDKLLSCFGGVEPS